MVRDACRACYWGPNGTKLCEIRSLPPSMRGESCQYWDLFRRLGEGDFDERGNSDPTD